MSETKYGAVDDNAQEQENEQNFDVEETYYIKEQPLTQQDKIRKYLAYGIPVAIALGLLIGGGIYLLVDFGNLYPSSPKDVYPQIRIIPLPPITPPPTLPPPTAAPVSTTQHSPFCKENEGCADLGLTGLCCPTKDGIALDCCH